MKLYSRKHFILAAICILPIIYECKHFNGATSTLWVGFFLYMMIRCFMTAFSAELLEKEETTAEKDKIVRKKMLGPLWRAPLLIILGLCFGGVLLYAWLWPSDWSGALLFICFVAATVFGLWYNVRYRELMKQEEKREDDEEAKS